MRDRRARFMDRARRLKGMRTPLSGAIKGVLDTLSGYGGNYTVTSLADETNLNRRTVEKAVDAIVEMQRVLEDRKIVLEDVNRTKVLRLEPRFGLRNVPEDVQRLLIRSAYFPLPSREQEILAYLCLRGSTSYSKALKLDRTESILKLLDQGQIARTRQGRIYLTKEGILTARGTLDIYPELHNVQNIS